MEIKKLMEKLLETLKSMKEFRKVEFIIFYGSRAQEISLKSSDIDVCIYYNSKRKEEMNRFRLKVLSKLPSIFDIQIFQLLPLYVRKEVLKGKVLYVKNIGFIYQKAYETIKDFESFKPYFHYYIGMRK
jgi:predicted nucleotidyltransferase